MEIKELEDKLESTLLVLKEDLNGVQVGQVSEKMLKNITITHENSKKQNILETSSVRVHGNNCLIVKPHVLDDIGLIEKSIISGMQVNTVKQGHEILITFPPITTERRAQIAKSILEYGNKAKQSGRDIRHNYLKQNKGNTKEEQIKIEKKIAPLLENFNKKIDDLIKNKQEKIQKI